MSDILVSMLSVVLLIAIAPLSVYLLYNAHLVFYYGIKVGFKRVKAPPKAWRDAWGLFRFGQFYAPELVDDEGKEIQKKARIALRRFIIAAPIGVILGLVFEALKTSGD